MFEACYDQPLYHVEMTFFYNKPICQKNVRQEFVMGKLHVINIYSVQNCFGSANFAKVKTQRACSVDFEVRLKFGWGQIELTIPLRWTVQDIQVLVL